MAHDTSTPVGVDCLNDWLCAEAEVRARQDRFGLWDRGEVSGLSGLKIFRAVCQGLISAPPLLGTLGIQIIEVDHGQIVLQARPQPGHLNPLGSAHGGWIATLLDSAAGCAVHTTVGPGQSCTTSNLNIHYVRAITSEVPMVRAIGRVVHQGRLLGTSEAQVIGADGTLYAHATSTVVILQPR